MRGTGAGAAPPALGPGRGSDVCYIHHPRHGGAVLIRTQIYLSAEAQRGLRALSRRTGVSRSELVRQAVDALLADAPEPERSVAEPEAAPRHGGAARPAARRR